MPHSAKHLFNNEMIVDEAEGRINYRFIEIKSE